MLLLTSTSDLVQVITAAAETVEVHASYIDNNAGTITPGRTNTADITTATTTTIVAAPGSGVQRNVKSIHIHSAATANSNLVRVLHTDGTTSHDLIHATLLPAEGLILDAEGKWTHYTADGLVKAAYPAIVYNQATAAQGPGFATDTYVTGSFVVFPAAPKVGTRYRCRISVSKSAAGTATPIVQVRTGTAGSTADTSRNSFTFSAGTAATDVGMFDVEIVFRSVGSGTSAVMQGHCGLISQPTTGFSSLLKGVQTTSGGFDSTTAGLGIGVSVNGGTSAAWTVQMVNAEILNAT